MENCRAYVTNDMCAPLRVGTNLHEMDLLRASREIEPIDVHA